MNRPNIAVIGAGIWGKNIVRNFYNLGVLHTVCDIDSQNLENIKSLYPEIITTKSYKDIMNNSEIDAVAVVTPSHTHFRLVREVLESNKHVYVEKPLSTVSKEADDLIKLADDKNLVLMVGHLLLYHPVVNRLKMLVDDGILGDIKYVQSDRLNINYFKNDRSVMWDLAPHDVSMSSYIISQQPHRIISATGASTEFNEILDITHITFECDKGAIIHISNSWVHPQKRVNLLIRGTKATAIFDDTLSDNKLMIYDNNSSSKQKVLSVDYIEIEPLKLECQHFLSCIGTGNKARSDGENGYKVVKILEEAEKLMLGDRLKNLNNVDFASSRSKK